MVNAKQKKWVLIALAVIIVAFGHNVQGASNTMSPMKRYHHYIAFTLWPENTVYLMTPDGRFWARLAVGNVSSSEITWSPDGTQIAFFAFDGEDETNSFLSIYNLTKHEGKVVRFTPTLSGIGFPAWSPDGNRIAFIACCSYLYSIEVKSLAETLLMPQSLSPSPISWAPSGQYIAYSVDVSNAHEEIFILDVALATSVNLTGFTPENEFQPAWSPDGTRIAFVGGYSSRIGVMNADGSHRVYLTDFAHSVETSRQIVSVFPTWSPDSMQIAFVSNRDRERGFDLYVIQADGTNLIRLSHLPENMSVYAPAWSPWLDKPLDLDWQPTPWSVSEE